MLAYVQMARHGVLAVTNALISCKHFSNVFCAAAGLNSGERREKREIRP
jgi:hypothetical protein